MWLLIEEDSHQMIVNENSIKKITKRKGLYGSREFNIYFDNDESMIRVKILSIEKLDKIWLNGGWTTF